MLVNICKLKNYGNFKNSGLTLLVGFLKSFFNCDVRLQQHPIEKFEEHFNLDVHSNPRRNCYRISENEMAIIVKVWGANKNEIMAVMPIVLAAENISNTANTLFEKLSILISKKLTECYSNSFHFGPKYFGDGFAREFIATCLSARHYDFSRILFLIETFEKLAGTTFEGNYFTTGLIISRSLFEYNGKNGKNRGGVLYRLENDYDVIRKPLVDKRFWYLMDGMNSFYITDQTLVIRNLFIRNEASTSVDGFFDSYYLEDTLFGSDIAFRVIGPNEISIITNEGFEFIKIENRWKIRNFEYLNRYLKARLTMEDSVRQGIIYYSTVCSKNHCSSIIWIPQNEDINAINALVSSKNKIWRNELFITDGKNQCIIQRLLSSDGVTIISSSGKVLYCGAIVKLDISEKEGLMGTGENAAKTLSQNGVAIKISQDGNIKIYSSSATAFVY